MHKYRTHLLTLVGLCLLAMQVTGLHLHASLDGLGDVHSSHIHEFDSDEHGHEAATDVTVLESATGWVKPLPFLVLFIAALFAIVTFTKQFRALLSTTQYTRLHYRWRPPLRAPPLLVS